MGFDFLSQAATFLQEQKKHRRQTAVFLCLAVVVVFGTVAALKMYGVAMTHKVKVLECAEEVHEHTDSCYEKDEQGNPGEETICGYADYVVHVHNDDCYDARGGLVCQIPEREPHTHTEECIAVEKVLVCGLEGIEAGSEEADGSAEDGTNGNTADSGEAADVLSTADSNAGSGTGSAENAITCGKEEHAHTDECYTEVLACTETGHTHDDSCYSETLNCTETGHTHGDSCYTETLNCTETGHAHSEACYDGDGNLTCGQEESVHEHGEGCYTKELTCGQEESVHEHGEGCYLKELICGQEESVHEHGEGCYAKELTCEVEEHTHTEECYNRTEGSEPQDVSGQEAQSQETQEPQSQEDPAGAAEEPGEGNGAHVHTDECYEERITYVCGENELHVHTDECYDKEDFDKDGNLLEGSLPDCGLLQLEEHVHTADCFKTVEMTPEEIAELNLHVEHDESCYDEEGNLICAYAEEETYYCGKEEHTHDEDCYDEAGNLTCELEEHTHDESCLEEPETVYYCGKEEHAHGEECYDEAGNLTCGLEEHIHDESCLEEPETVYYCGKEEHAHGEECYDEEGNMVCGLEEHTHDESCLEEQETIYYCGKEEHAHGEGCYDEEGNLTCELEEHTHNAVCLVEEPVFYCGKEEHIHSEGCYDEAGNLTCGLEEHTHNGICLAEEPIFYCGKEEHAHSKDCYDEEGNLICELEEHVHDESCLIEPTYYCRKEAHTHGDGCYDEAGNLICGLEEHTHNAICLIENPFFYCGKEEHTHGNGCYDGEGNLICGLEEHVHDESCLIPGIKLTAETEDYFIALEASADAFPDAEGELTLEAVKLEEDSPEHEAASQLVEKKLEQDRIEKEEAEAAEKAKNGEEDAFPFDISITADDGEEIPVLMQKEEAWEQRIFDLRVLADGVEVQPVMPVRVSFIRKAGAEAVAAGISEEPQEGSTLSNSQEGGSASEAQDGAEAQPGEEVRIFHVDYEKALVEDMNAVKDEEGNTVINTPHFSDYAVITVTQADGNTKVVNVPDANTPWQRLALLFYNAEVNGCTVEIKLQDDLVVENLDDQNQPIVAMPIWIDSNRTLILDLNGHKIISGNSSVEMEKKAWFRVGNQNGIGFLVIKDSASNVIDQRISEPLQTVPDYGVETWNQYYRGGYDFVNQKAVYYLTESDRRITASSSELPGIPIGTEEKTYRHEISFEKSGAIENNTREELDALIYIGRGGDVTIEGGRLTNLYGSAIISPNEEAEYEKTIAINGGYLVGNGTVKSRDWGGAVFADGNCNMTIGEKAVIIVNRSNSEGGGVHLDSKGKKPFVTIKQGCIVSSNETSGRGGGINVKGAKLTVEGGTITNNFAGSGGGLSVDGEFEIQDVLIAGNAVGGGGGGLYIGNAELGIIKGGVCASNWARAEGGGIRLESGHVMLEADADSGKLLYITNNKTISDTMITNEKGEKEGSKDWGGGGIFISDNNGKMTIYDSVVTENTAGGFGGGVSGCSTGRLSIEETRGTAVYGNTAIGVSLSGGSSSKHDDHDAYNDPVFNAIDEKGEYKKDFQDIFSALSSIVGAKMLGGGYAGWTGSCDYAYVTNNRQDIISTKSLGLTAHPEEDAVPQARQAARIFISGNYSGTHGGGIMCNGLVVLGQKSDVRYNESLTIDFKKAYFGINDDEKNPTDNQFKFELLDEAGTKLAEYSTTANLNTSETNVLGVLSIDFKRDGELPEITGSEVVEVTSGDSVIGKNTYYLKEIIPKDEQSKNSMRYDETIYKIEFDVKCKGKKISLGPNYELTQYWLYIDNANSTVSIVDAVGGRVIEDVTASYEFKDTGDYGGGTGHKGAHLSLTGKTETIDGKEISSDAAFTNADMVEKLSLKILKKNQLQVEQGKEGYMSNVNFQLTALTDEGRKDESADIVSGKTDDSGVLEFSAIPNIKAKYLLEESVPDGFEKAGPWIVEANGRNNLSIYVAEEVEQKETVNGVEQTYKVYQKKRSEQLTVVKKEENGAIKLWVEIKNIPILYALPETGGSGIVLYTMAGILILAFGAGLMYRKKFGERRGRDL